MPSSEIRDLRDLTRLRKTLVRERSSQVNRVSKILELANVKLGSVVSNVMGVTGRAILDAMIAGEDDPKVLAGLAKGSLRGKHRELAEAVPGLMRDYHRFVLRRYLDLIDELTRQIERIEAQIFAETSGPFGAALNLLQKGSLNLGAVRVQDLQRPLASQDSTRIQAGLLPRLRSTPDRRAGHGRRDGLVLGPEVLRFNAEPRREVRLPCGLHRRTGQEVSGQPVA